MEAIFEILAILIGGIFALCFLALIFFLPLLGCFLLFRLVISKRRTLWKVSATAAELPHGKAKKEYRNKNFAVQRKAGFIVGTIALIFLTALFFSLAIGMRFLNG